MGREENIDASGGGTIVRQFYVEPYTSAKYVVIVLKGTIDFTQNPAVRIKPMSDPLYNNFFCTDVKVRPWSNEAVTGGAPHNFTPSTDVTTLSTTGNSQYANIAAALGVADDFDYGNIIDFAASPPLTPAQIQVGGVVQSNGTNSNGRCGAIVTATYNPIHCITGWPADPPIDPFDCVDPKLTPVIKSTQLGRDLQAIANSNIFVPGSPYADMAFGGVSDTASVPETLFDLTFKRIMVPYVPKVTFTELIDKINKNAFNFGNFIDGPPGVIRIDCPTVETCVCPDSTLETPKFYYNITLHFTIRMISAEYYNPDSIETGRSGTWEIGRIMWNWQLCHPDAGWMANWIEAKQIGYYPIGWISSPLGYWGNWRPLYLYDQGGSSGNPDGVSIADMLTAGFMETD